MTIAVSFSTNSKENTSIPIVSSTNITNEDAADDIELVKYYVTLMTEESYYTWYITYCERKGKLVFSKW